jgi:T5SS/PEP-CTERM-associated repeat protein
LHRAAAIVVSLISLAEAVRPARADTYGFFGATETLPGYGAHPTGMYSGTNGAPPVFAYNLSGSFTDASAWDDYNEAYSPTTGLFAQQAPGAGDTVTIGGLPAGWETPTEGPATTDSSGDPVYGYYGLTEAGYDGGNGFQVGGASGTIANLGVGGPGTLTLGSLNVTDSTVIESVGAIPLIEFTADGGFTTTGVVGSVLTVSSGSLSTPSLALCATTDLSVQGADPVADAGSLVFSAATISGDTTQILGVPPQTGSPNDAFNAQPVEFDDSNLNAKTELDIVGVDTSMYPNATGTTTLIADNSSIKAGAVVIATGSTGFGSGSPFCTAALTLTDASTLTATSTGDSPSSLIVGDTGDGTLTAEEGSEIDTQQTVIGNDILSTGNATLDASTWNNESFLTVGSDGDGTLNVTDDAELTTGDVMYVGLNDGSNGTLAISDGATVTTDTTGIDGTNSTVVGTEAGSSGTITIDGEGSQLESKGDMAIGYSGDGVVQITNGGALLIDGNIFRIGRNDGSNGTLTVTDSGSSVSAPDATMYVGYGGSGTVNVEDGGSLSVQATSIGGQEDGTGVVNIDGDGTQADLGTLTVGDGGDGTLNITGGAAVSTGTIVIGADFEDAGMFLIAGDTTGVNAGGDITVGDAAAGALTVTGGATLSSEGLIVGSQETGVGTLLVESGSTLTTSDDATVGDEEGSMGTVGVDGTGTRLTINGDFTIGGGGDGLITVLDNSTLMNQAAIVGRDEDSDGFALVSGTGSTWHSTGDMTIGQSGSGEVLVEEGATLQVDGDLLVGQNDGSEGTLTIDGANTQFIYGGGDISIGSFGSGAFTVQNAAFVDISGVDTTVGDGEDGEGTLTVTDPDTILNTGGLTVGGEGTGELLVQNGGALTSGSSTIGDMEEAEGTATVTDAGSTWTASDLTVGGGGDGTLIIENGGVVTVNSTELSIGDESTGRGTLVLSGAGSQLNFTGNLQVGEDGSGVFAVQGGAAFTGHAVNIGDKSDGIGTVNLDGTGTTMEVQTDFNIGVQGTGYLHLTNNAILTADGNATIADMLDSTGVATVDSASAWNTAGTLTVGGQSSGTLTVTGGGTVSANNMVIGDQSTGGGTVNVTGTGNLASASLLYTGTLTVGNSGAGTLDITAGGSVAPTGTGSGQVFVGMGGYSTIAVDGTKSHFEATSLTMGRLSQLLLTDAGSAHVATTVNSGSPSSINVTGGGLTIGAASPLAATGNVQVNSGGTLSGGESVTGNVVNGGTVTPGGPTTLSITGDYTQSGNGILQFEIEGTAAQDFDHLDVNGNVSLASGSTIEVSFSNGFTPQVGNSFQVISYGTLDPVNNTFSHLEATGLPANEGFTVNDDGNGLDVDIVAATPEPSTVSILILGAIPLLRRRRRSR